MKNEYGLDVSYFNSLIQRMARDIDRYTPDEFARQCLRMSVTADSKVITEPEFRAALAEHGMVAVPVNTVKTEKAKPMPSIWEVGMMVEYVVDMEWGPRKGSKGRIVKIRDEDIGTDAREYQVFWVEPLRGSGRFWTTPSDIKWISDEAMLAAAEKEHVNQVR